MVAAQRVKKTDCAGAKGYDAGKKASAIKRHIVVASPGLPHAIVVTTANVADRQGALEAFEQNKKTLNLKWFRFWLMGTILANRLPRPSTTCLGLRCKSPNATSDTRLRLFIGVGWSNDHFPGWKNTSGFGKIPNASLIPFTIYQLGFSGFVAAKILN